MAKATIFKDVFNTSTPHYIGVNQLLKRIAEGNSKDTVDKIRKLKSEGKDYVSIKKSLPSAIFSGEGRTGIKKVYESGKKKGVEYISYRENESITEHSGYAVLDFDHVDVESTKSQLKQDPYIYAAWVSPSGDGVKALFRLPQDIQKHSEYYESFIQRYPSLDSTSRNIARLCFESYDPDIYINRNAKVWDKRVSREEVVERKERASTRKARNIISTIRTIIRGSLNGEKHNTLLRAANLAGGYIATGALDEAEAISVMEQEIQALSPKDFSQAQKTIKDGIENGKRMPLHEVKKWEKEVQFVKREDGEYDFIASNEEMDEYEQALINGTLEMGLPLIPELDTAWMLKKHHLVWFGGIDNVGKSFILWYLAVLSAMKHGWKTLVFSAENKDAQVRKKMKEFYIGKPITQMTQQERDDASAFFDEHFRIMTNKKMYTWEDFLLHAEVYYDEKWQYDVLIAEPYNSMDVPASMDGHRHNLNTLNRLRVFKENYSTVWIADHAATQAARNKDGDGHIIAPWKSDIDGGQLKSNKTDDFIILHRKVSHETEWNVTEFHSQKIKDVESGGLPTLKDSPIRFIINRNYCGFTVSGKDVVLEHWSKAHSPKVMDVDAMYEGDSL